MPPQPSTYLEPFWRVANGLSVSAGEVIEMGPSTFHVEIDAEYFALTTLEILQLAAELYRRS